MGTARYSFAGASTQTDGIGFAGTAGAGVLTNTEEFTGAFLSVKKITTS